MGCASSPCARPQQTRAIPSVRRDPLHHKAPESDAGGLISYEPDLDELVGHAAVFVDKIVRGARPAGLPVELRTTFELIINLRSAWLLAARVADSLRIASTFAKMLNWTSRMRPHVRRDRSERVSRLRTKRP